MAHPFEQLGPEGLLQIWGLRIAGSSLKDPIKKATGGGPSLDDELAVVDYVESTPGFKKARPVLVHVFVDHKPIDSYRYVDIETGESIFAAAIRHGQPMTYVWLRKFHPECRLGVVLAKDLLNQFLARLAWELKEDPFRVPLILPERPVKDVVDEVSEEVDRKHEGDRRTW